MRVPGRDHLEGGARFHRVLARATERFADAALEREVGEWDDRFFAQLEEREAQVDVYGEVFGADLIEHRPPTVLVGALAESPGELAALALGAERIAKRNPAAPCDAVHDHAPASVAKEEGLVAEQRQVGDRVRGCLLYTSPTH